MTYYWKDGSDTYHTNQPTTCSKNFYPADGWHKGDTKPSDKTDKCDVCDRLDRGTATPAG